MILVKPSFVVESMPNREAGISLLEAAARICYLSTPEEEMKDVEAFLKKKILDSGHHSVIEHISASVRFICNRGVTHEKVRHRIASYSQESTRYCNYSKEKFGNEIKVIDPFFFDKEEEREVVHLPFPYKTPSGNLKLEEEDSTEFMNKFDGWHSAILMAEWHYMKLIEMGAKPQEARDVLPNATKTEILMTANIREWRHFFRLRTSKKAHPQMREVAIPLFEVFKERLPLLFEDFDTDWGEKTPGNSDWSLDGSNDFLGGEVQV